MLFRSSDGKELQDVGEDAQIPALYVAMPLTKDLSFGLSVASLFGLATKYDSGWVASDISLENNILSININPSLSYKINDKISIGAGFQTQYAKATFTKSANDLGSPLVKSKGNDWGYGYNFGLKYNFNDDIKLGVGYRSKITHKFSGSTNVANLVINSDVTFKTDTPESITAGLTYQVKDNLQLAFDTSWTRWSRLQYMTFNHSKNQNILNLVNTVKFKWRDSFLYSLGANYDFNDNLLLRFGTAYEADAVTNANRNYSVPTGDRIWLSTGLRYKLSKNLAIDATYVNQLYDNVEVDTSADKINSSLEKKTNSIYGKFKTRVDVISFGLKVDF